MSAAATPTRVVEPRISRSQAASRAVVVVSAVVAIAVTRIAGDDALLGLEIAIAVSVALSVLLPDSHPGVVAVLLVALHWVVAVDDAVGPLVVVMAFAVAGLHVGLAASSVAPARSPLTAAMVRRWVRRGMLVGLSCVPVWVTVAALAEVEPASSEPLVAAALVTVVVGLRLLHRRLTPAP